MHLHQYGACMHANRTEEKQTNITCRGFKTIFVVHKQTQTQSYGDGGSALAKNVIILKFNEHNKISGFSTATTIRLHILYPNSVNPGARIFVL